MATKSIRRRSRRRRQLGSFHDVITKRVKIGPLNVPIFAVGGGVLLLGVGGLILWRMNAARNTEADGMGEDYYDSPGTGPCSKIEDAFDLPKGCGTVGVWGYKKVGWHQGEKRRIEITEIPGYPGHYLQSAPHNALAAFMRMKQAAKDEAGLNITLNSSFRTMGKQNALYKGFLKRGKPVVAYPGTSPHQMALAVDIQTAGGTLPIYKWLINNCQRFGFYRTVPSETWHYHYYADRDPFLKKG